VNGDVVHEHDISSFKGSEPNSVRHRPGTSHRGPGRSS
jgi:hypothetical protein